jgi:hypothetical protein
LNCTLLGSSNLVLACLVKGGEVSFEFFKHLLNSITLSSILKVLITNYLLNFNSELVYNFNLQIVSLKLIKVNALKHLKVVLFKQREG